MVEGAECVSFLLLILTPPPSPQWVGRSSGSPLLFSELWCTEQCLSCFLFSSGFGATPTGVQRLPLALCSRITLGHVQNHAVLGPSPACSEPASL